MTHNGPQSWDKHNTSYIILEMLGMPKMGTEERVTQLPLLSRGLLLFKYKEICK